MFLRSILKTLLYNTAKQKLHEKAAETVAQHARDGTQSEDGPPQSCDIGIVFALGVEAGGLVDLLQEVTTTKCDGFVVRRGELNGRHVVLVESGAGAKAAAKATKALIEGHQPSWVISAGFAGGLISKLARHDILFVNEMLNHTGDRLAIDLKVDPQELSKTPGVHLGKLISVEQIVCTRAEKQELGLQYNVLAADLETFAVAEVCGKNKTRFLAVRVISDSIDDELPADVQTLTDQKTNAARLGAAVGSIWRRPASLKDMYKLRENALVSSNRLARFLVGIIDRLCPISED